ncbi:MAG: SDR family NAD(P)-dependent oxidoreductase [Calditrichia bacterium]
MKIGVTGCAGFLGSNLCDELIARGHKVWGVDNFSMGRPQNIAQLKGNERFHFKKLDVRNLAEMRAFFREVETIVHLAAFKIPRYGNALDTLLINHQGAYHVLEIARENGARAVLASTSDVYGKNTNLPFAETADLVLGPSTIQRWSYAVSKLYDEHLALAYRESYGVPVVILRFFGSYGPRHHLSWWGGPQSVFIRQILRDEPITIHGDGKQTRSFTYVSDTVDGIVRAVESADAEGEIFNIGSTREISIVGLAELIHQLCETGKPLRLEFIPYEQFSNGKYEDVMRRVPDISKARKILGFEPKVSLEEGLRRTIAWQRKEEAVLIQQYD